MRIGIAVAAAGLMALGACGGGEDNKAAGNGAAAAAGQPAGSGGGDEIRLQPGEWETKIEVKNASMPGMPEGMGDMMKSMNSTNRSCMTEEDVGKPGTFTGKNDANCKTEGFAAKGGKVSGTVTCTGEGGEGTMVMKTEGSFTPTSFESKVSQETETEGMKMKMDVHITGRRIGECPAGAQDVGAAENFKGRTKTGG